jgi:hypothetical protein
LAARRRRPARHRHRPRFYLRWRVGCLGCFIPLLAALAAAMIVAAVAATG